jgi:hypothetical protein
MPIPIHNDFSARNLPAPNRNDQLDFCKRSQ